MTTLVTGAAGFIGYHVAERLLARGDTVVGIDNLNSYYDVSLKEARLARLMGRRGFSFAKLDLADRTGMAALFGK
jgi:UDP-glucuronate 4-epimerase